MRKMNKVLAMLLALIMVLQMVPAIGAAAATSVTAAYVSDAGKIDASKVGYYWDAENLYYANGASYVAYDLDDLGVVLTDYNQKHTVTIGGAAVEVSFAPAKGAQLGAFTPWSHTGFTYNLGVDGTTVSLDNETTIDAATNSDPASDASMQSTNTAAWDHSKDLNLHMTLQFDALPENPRGDHGVFNGMQVAGCGLNMFLSNRVAGSSAETMLLYSIHMVGDALTLYVANSKAASGYGYPGVDLGVGLGEKFDLDFNWYTDGSVDVLVNGNFIVHIDDATRVLSGQTGQGFYFGLRYPANAGDTKFEISNVSVHEVAPATVADDVAETDLATVVAGVEKNVFGAATLPAAVQYAHGAMPIYWTSSNPAVLSNDGKVVAMPAADTRVTLTAACAGAEASVEVIVKANDYIAPSSALYSFPAQIQANQTVNVAINGDVYTIDGTVASATLLGSSHTANIDHVVRDLLFKQTVTIDAMPEQAYTSAAEASTGGFTMYIIDRVNGQGADCQTVALTIVNEGGKLYGYLNANTKFDLGVALGDTFEVMLRWNTDNSASVYVDGMCVGETDNATIVRGWNGNDQAGFKYNAAAEGTVKITWTDAAVYADPAAEFAAAYEALIASMDLSAVYGSASLPTQVTYGVAAMPISWTSSNADVLSAAGKVVASVTEDTQVILTATCAGVSKDVVATVKANDYIAPSSALYSFPALIQANQTVNVTINGDVYTIDGTVTSATLLGSTHTANIDHVVRDLLFKQTVTIDAMPEQAYTSAAEASTGGFTMYIIDRVNGQGADCQTAALTIVNEGGKLYGYLNANTKFDLGVALGDTFEVMLRWNTDNSAAVYVNGVCVGKAANATIVRGWNGNDQAGFNYNAAAEGTVKITWTDAAVYADPAAEFAAAYEALIASMDLSAVYGSASLPTQVTYGVAAMPISWTSSNADVLSAAGKVVASVTEDTQVILTATCAGVSKDVVATVKANDYIAPVDALYTFPAHINTGNSSNVDYTTNTGVYVIDSTVMPGDKANLEGKAHTANIDHIARDLLLKQTIRIDAMPELRYVSAAESSTGGFNMYIIDRVAGNGADCQTVTLTIVNEGGKLYGYLNANTKFDLGVALGDEFEVMLRWNTDNSAAVYVDGMCVGKADNATIVRGWNGTDQIGYRYLDMAAGDVKITWTDVAVYKDPAAVEMTSIEVAQLPELLDYLEGADALNLSGGVLQLNYSNGTSQQIDLAEATVTGFDNTVVGTQTLTVTYEGFTTTFDVRVNAKSLLSIAVSSLPNTTEYLEGKAELDVTGGKLLLTYNNGATEEIDMTADMVFGFDNLQVGPQTLEVRYETMSCTFQVEIIAKSLVSIEIAAMPYNINYLEGKDALDLSGGRLRLNYNNDTFEEIDLAMAQVDGFDNTVIGTQSLTVAYEGFATTFDVNVRAKSLVSIEVTTAPAKTEYLEGKDALDLAGGIVTVYYDNDTTEEIALSACEVTGFDNTVTGTQTLTVTYKGVSATMFVTVQAKSAVSIAVTTAPSKTEYLEGKESLDLTGGVLTVYYNNGATEEVDLANASIAGFNYHIVGTQTLSVSYGGFFTTFEVKIIAKSLASVKIVELPVITEYLEGLGDLDLSGGILQLNYNNGTFEQVYMEELEASGFDNTVIGKQTITVTYEGFTATFEVEVIGKSLTYIEITGWPEKYEYIEGEELDLTGGIVTLFYDNGTTTDIALADCIISGFDSTVLGVQYVEVEYAGQYTNFDVEVIAKSLESIAITAPSKTEYLEGKDALDLTGGKITLVYNNGTTEEIALTADMVSGFDNTVVGAQTLTATYEGFTATFEIAIIAKSLESIAITAPSKTEYLEGKDALDLTGGKITLVYNNGTTEEITLTADMVSGFDNTVVGAQTLTATYEGFTATFEIAIIAKSLESIAITAPAKVAYIEGKEELDVTGGKITLVYNNGTTEEIALTADMVSGFDNTVVGAQTLTATYEGFTATFEIIVIAYAAPAIITDIADIVYAPGDVTFTVEATGIGLTYAWFVNGEAAGTDAALTIAADESYNGAKIYCVITDAYGAAVTSAEATMTLKACDVKITWITGNATAVENKTVVFAVTATNAAAYQWQFSTNGADWADFANENAATRRMSFKAVAAYDNYLFRCRITDASGVSTYTAAMLLDVQVSELGFGQQPQDQKLPLNSTATFTAKMEGGVGNIYYQWYYLKPGAKNWAITTLTGYNTDTLRITVYNSRNGYQFKCVMKDSSGAKVESEPATLEVCDNTLSFTKQPQDVAIGANRDAVFTVEVSNVIEPVKYRWYFSKDGGQTWGACGNNTNTLVMYATMSRNGFLLRCVVSDATGHSIISQSAKLTVFKKAAAVDGVYYDTLAAAIAACENGSTITLLNDTVTKTAIVVPQGKTVTLDLNGKSLVYNSTVINEAMISNYGDLTINDSVGTGEIFYNYTGANDPAYFKGNYTISNAGTLTVNGGKIHIANLRAHAKYPINNNSTTGNAVLVINGGHLYNYNTAAIRQFCNSTTYQNSVTINGGVIEGYSAIWVQNPGAYTVNGQLSITGGEIKTTAAAYVNGTAELKDVASKIYFSTEGGAWDAASSVSITGGIINENVYLAEEAPASINVEGEAQFNGRVELP